MDFSKLTEAVEGIRKFVENAAGGGDKEEKPAGAVPGNSEASQLTSNARQSYQKTARWMLAAFAAVGVLIFGSLPFAAIADVELTWPNSLFLVGGLVLAVVGIVGAVIAVSLVSEPEDASLGELDSSLREIQKTDDKGFVWVKGHPVLTVNKLAALWNPRIASRIEFLNIVHGPESAAHLGPNLESAERQASVTNLIKKLGELESTHANLAPVAAKLTVSVESYEQRIADLTKLLTELRARQAEEGGLGNEIGAASAMYQAAAAKLDSEQAALGTEKQKLAEVDDQLKLYHDHRELVLAEAGVMQLRGTFRLARRILAVAAVLTLFGGTGYALALPGATSTASTPPAAAPATTTPAPPVYATGLAATVVVHDGTSAAQELPRGCVERQLTAIWVGSGRVPATTGPFTVVVTDPACTGEITVAKGEGRFTLAG